MSNKFFAKSTSLWCFGLMTAISSGCATTNVVTVRDCADAVNIRKDTTVYHYWWGLKKASDVNPGCNINYNHLNGVTIKSRPKNILISFFSLGIVLPQTVSWCCAPPNTTPGKLGNN